LIRNNINRRSIVEANHIRFANHTKVSSKTADKLNGWLLGDGGIRFTGKQAYFYLTSKHKEYIDYALGEMSFLLEVNYLKSFQEMYVGTGLKETIVYLKKVLDL